MSALSKKVLLNLYWLQRNQHFRIYLHSHHCKLCCSNQDTKICSSWLYCKINLVWIALKLRMSLLKCICGFEHLCTEYKFMFPNKKVISVDDTRKLFFFLRLFLQTIIKWLFGIKTQLTLFHFLIVLIFIFYLTFWLRDGNLRDEEINNFTSLLEKGLIVFYLGDRVQHKLFTVIPMDRQYYMWLKG